MTSRDRLLVVGAAVASVLVAAPGIHLFELWLSPRGAVIVSHGLALLGLALTVAFWRRRHAQTAAGSSPAV